MADTGAQKMEWFSWEEHLLDVLLIGWFGWAALIVCVVNAVLTFFGPLQPRVSWDKSKDTSTGVAPIVQGTAHPESCSWLNCALNWFYLHYNNFPEFVDAWVLALNEQAAKLGGPVQLKFEQVKSGSLPPKFGEVQYEAGPEDKYVVNCRVDSRDLSFAVFASQQTHEGVKLTNLTVSILKLRGSLKIRCFREGKDMMANVSFSGRPDIKVQGKPVNPYQDPSDLVDIGVTEEVVRNAICLASTTFNVSKWVTGPDTIPFQRTMSAEGRSDNLLMPGSSPSSPRVQQQQVFEPIELKEQQQQHSAFHAPVNAAPPNQASPRRPQQQLGRDDKRLLAKVIKASGLKQSDTGSIDPYCVVYVDTPPQSEVTGVVRNTLNPFWDEQFFFDMSPNSQEIRFEILDKKRTAKDNFLGEALVYCEDLRRNPSSRQIIPLQGRLGAGEFVSGSITVEFLCMDFSDDVNDPNQVSPRRMIETSKSMTPGGTLVTTTTTTTHKPQNARYQSSMDGSPSYVEKREFDYDVRDPEHSSLGSADVVHINGVESVAETAIRALSDRARNPRTPSKTSTLIITGVKRTIESSPTDELDSSMAPSSPESPETIHPPKEKKKSLAQTIKQRFSRSKKRSHSADRASSSLREGSNYLRPPDKAYGPHSKDDIELVRGSKHDDPQNLKKSRSLGGSLKKLFRRSRKRSRSRGKGETSRESSLSRQSRHTSQGLSREGSLNRTTPTPHQETMVL